MPPLLEQVRRARLHVPPLRRLHVRVPGPHGERVIRHPVVGEYVRQDARASYRRTLRRSLFHDLVSSHPRLPCVNGDGARAGRRRTRHQRPLSAVHDLLGQNT
jgi:hypothetical protein